MQIHTKFSRASAREFASSSISLAELSILPDSRRKIVKTEQHTCEDPQCKMPDTILSQYNKIIVKENGRNIRVCSACQTRRNRAAQEKLRELPSRVDQRGMMEANAKISRETGFHHVSGRLLRRLP